MSFPTSPTTGQVHPQDGKVWQFNGAAWQAFKTPVYWFAVDGKPTAFPPTAHTHTSSEITDFVQAVNDIITVVDAGTY